MKAQGVKPLHSKFFFSNMGYYFCFRTILKPLKTYIMLKPYSFGIREKKPYYYTYLGKEPVDRLPTHNFLHEADNWIH